MATSVVVTAALAWSGWRLVTQQRELDARQARQTVETAADALGSDIREALATQGDRLSARLGGNEDLPPPPGGVAVTWREGRAPVPSGSLPFVPWPPAGRVRADLFADAEAAEFGRNELDVASQRYRSLAGHADAAIRAGALLRLARVLRRRGDWPGAIAASSALATLGDQDVDGIPASLAGLDGQRLAHTQRGDIDAARRVAEEIRQRLDHGQWALERGTAEFYRDEVSSAPRPDAWLLAAAVADTWEAHARPALPARGLTTVSQGGRSVIIAWRATANEAAVEAAFADQFLPSSARDGVAWHLTDSDANPIAGGTRVLPVDTVARVIGGGSSWLLRVWSSSSDAVPRGRQEPLLIAATAGTVLFVWAAVGLMAWALTREARVAQLQTDFVAAVSHEFRSPLTTMRQMAEMLEADRVPNEARRRQYYRVLTGETTRLQRLVERLLDFGRMEAGRDEMRKEHVDVAGLVREVVDEMQERASERGGRITVIPATASLSVAGDPHALRLVIRNLVENAIKYSPESPAVTLHLAGAGVGRDRHREWATIAVSDTGPGIAKDEQRAIFGKFVRGRAATASRVRGTGVGLAAAKHVADAHGGAITLESEPGRGSTFTVWLPVAGTAVDVSDPADLGTEA